MALEITCESDGYLYEWIKVSEAELEKIKTYCKKEKTDLEWSFLSRDLDDILFGDKSNYNPDGFVYGIAIDSEDLFINPVEFKINNSIYYFNGAEVKEDNNFTEPVPEGIETDNKDRAIFLRTNRGISVQDETFKYPNSLVTDVAWPEFEKGEYLFLIESSKRGRWIYTLEEVTDFDPKKLNFEVLEFLEEIYILSRIEYGGVELGLEFDEVETYRERLRIFTQNEQGLITEIYIVV